MRAKKVLVLLTLAVFLVMASGCGKGSSAPSQKETKPLTVGWAQWCTNLDPGDGYNGWYTMEFGMGETLVRVGEGMKIEPWLAESWTRVDEKTWKIKIRDNVKFHNGKILDGAAVKASLERTIGINERAPGLLDIASIEAQGNEVIIKTNNPNPSFMTSLADPFATIVDAEAAEEMGDKFKENPVLTGPFKLKEYVRDERVVVVRNEEYWGKKAELKEVVFKYIPDANTRIMALQSGEIQVADKIPAEQVELLERNKELKVLSESSGRVHMLVFNLERPGLDDINVRKAINMAINRDDLAQKVMSGTGIPAIGPFPPVLPFGGSELKGYHYDPAGAKRLLDEAGWKTGSDGIRQKGGKKLEYTFLSYKSRPELPVIMEAIQSQLLDIGIKIEINNVENISEAMKGGDFDAAIYSFSTAPTGDPQYMLETVFLTGGDNNFGHYSSEKLDALGRKLQSTFDTEERKTIAKEAQQILIDDAAFAFLVYPKIITAVHKDVEGVVITPTEWYFLNSNVGYKG
ncbi:MAG: peptide/nickel transport system substrate-binding protein [Clostridia bacterium]|nr:peptide/nickel transport system substrate-binding protein [Clostridia bacterium]MDN5375075.1 peptide/nickel transport system substrate-binding protein [Thermacetogenium sp.]